MARATITPARRTMTAIIALTTGLTGAASLAQAQTTSTPPAADAPARGGASNGASDGASIPEIIVTAQFRAQRLQDTPIAITATSGAELEAKSVESVTDLTAIAPNVNLSQATGLNGSAIQAYIRGIGQNDSSFALEPGVGIYIDDVYYGTTFGAILELNDLDRVEVLRGPQGTLSGKNSIGGSIKLFSKKPDGNGGGFLEASTGSYGRLDFKGSADFTIADGLYARVSGMSKHTDGYMTLLDYGCLYPDSGITATTGSKSCKTGTEGGIDIHGGRLALRYQPDGSPLEINLVGDYSQNNSEQVATKLIAADNSAVRSYVADDASAGVPFDSRFITGAHSYTSYANYASGGNYDSVFGPYQVEPGSFTTSPENTAKAWGVAGHVDYQLGDHLALTSITAYREAHGKTGIDLDGSPLSLLTQEFTYGHKQFTQELRLSAQLGTLADMTVGGYYYNARDRITGRVLLPTSQLDFIQDDPVTNRSTSAFVHGELHLTDALNLIGGLRYTDDKKTYVFHRSNTDGSVPDGASLVNLLVVGLNDQSSTYTGDRIDWRLGANYRFSPELMVYAQVATGYKGGGTNPRPYVVDQIVTFDPETLVTYEAGFKSDLLDRRLRFNGTFFYNDYKNIQINRYTCSESVLSTCSEPANAGNAHVWGLEGELFAEPLDGLQIDGSFGYLHFQYTSVDASTGVSLAMKAPFNPSWQSSAGVQYKADLGHGIGTLTPRFDWTYQSAFYFNSVNADTNKVAARSLFNLRLTYASHDGDWELSSAITNLFDKFYYTGKADNYSNYGVVTGAVGRPREWFVALRRSF
ncbi:TonB-dependent receptor [Novosphingobium sp. 1949]|uniref:TonB-dependent receptor n=1 Tax=Novosphingobium organovorum TaxID=2930092 RepID=A0ABT0BAA3_9SPHN|nr:TonB-dependent receptor [Novosphingobium organovorum]MCJ2181800.1 TonB-dependent receptor [Novosphingobium organovorum]